MFAFVAALRRWLKSIYCASFLLCLLLHALRNCSSVWPGICAGGRDDPTAFLQQEIGEKAFYLKNMGRKVAQASCLAANINIKRGWVALKIIEPALGQIIGVREKIGKGQ